jgi:hypothetical protein
MKPTNPNYIPPSGNYIALTRKCPAEWRKGFTGTGRYIVACGGKEEPVYRNGKWHLLVWDTEERKHADYCYDDDIFYPV